MALTEEIVTEVKAHVSSLFWQYSNMQLPYHNLLHTERVVKAAEKISAHYDLPAEDKLIITTAAWFHDVGYLLGIPEEHEIRGTETAAIFLRSKNMDEPTIEKVKGCILATKMPQNPQNLLEEIVCDADVFDLGTDQFKVNDNNMHKEKELISGKYITKQEWRQQTIKFLEAHHYFTSYANEKAGTIKAENLEKLKTKFLEKGGAYIPVTTEPTPEEIKAARKKEKENTPERGIETMFRITSANHLKLSDMADSKANIMISVNSIIVSVLLSVLFRRLEEFPNLKIPTIIFLAVCVLTIVFAVLATRPKISTGKFTKEDIDQKKTNLLFFGNFHKMTLEEYEWGMMEMMKNKDYLYGSLIKDIYFLGVVLGRKYRLLRIAYSIFMFGFVIAVLSFAVAIFFFPVTT
ncbi:MAG: Pycsar system effector family protein [Sphingobacteriales bacterium]